MAKLQLFDLPRGRPGLDAGTGSPAGPIWMHTAPSRVPFVQCASWTGGVDE